MRLNHLQPVRTVDDGAIKNVYFYPKDLWRLRISVSTRVQKE